MFDTIIIPLDMSAQAEAAIPVAVEEARRHRARLVLLHVISPSQLSSGEADVRAQGTAREDAARAYLEGVRQRFGLPANTAMRIVVGEPVTRIQAEVDAWPRGLLVMTTGDAADRERLPLGEVARRLLVSGRVPVLGIRPGG